MNHFEEKGQMMRTRLTTIVLFLSLIYALNLFTTPANAQAAGNSASTPTASAWKIQWRADRDLHAITALPGGTVYAVGDHGAFYKSVDGGQHWHYQKVCNENLHGALFRPDGHGWVVGAKGVIFQTSNGGMTWTAQQSHTIDNLSAIAEDGAGRLWVVGEHGVLLRSIDDQTWQVMSPPTIFALTAVHFTDNTNGWIVGTHGVLLRTTDAGATWHAENIGASWLYDIAFSENGREGWIVGDGGAILHSTDAGANWQTIANHVNYNLRGVAVDGNGTAWVIGAGGFIASVDDHGVHQHLTNVRTKLSGATIVDGVIWFAGAWNAILRSRDGGNSWDMPNGGGVYEFFDVSFPDAKHGWAVGQRHHQQNAEKHVGIIFHTDDGGYSWEMQHFPGESGEFEGVSFADAKRGVVTGRYGKALYTDDGGLTWHTQTLPPAAHWIYRVEMDPTGNAWAGASFGRLYHTTDFGHTWEYYCLHFPSPGEGVCIDKFNLTVRGLAAVDRNVWLLGKDGQMEVGTDVGVGRMNAADSTAHENWYRVPLLSGRAFNHLNNGYFLNANEGWVVGVAGALWHTLDGGRSSNDWTLMTPTDTLPTAWRIADLYDVQFANQKTGIVVGGQCDDYSRPANPASGDDHFWCVYAYADDYTYDRAFLARTKDGGQHWQTDIIPGIPLLYEVDMVGDNAAWAVGAAGAIVHYAGEPSASIAYQMNVAPAIDGNLNDWPHTGVISVTAATADSVQGTELPSPADLSATLRTVWLPDRLLVGVHVIDDRVEASAADFLNDDGIELGIDGAHDRLGGGADDHLYLITATGAVYDWMTPTIAISAAVHTVTDGYEVELSIPAAQIMGQPGVLSAGQQIGFSLALRDNDNGGAIDNVIVKDGTDPGVPSAEFGTITLRGQQIVLQRDLNDYSRVQDTYIDRYHATTNYAKQDSSRLHLLHLAANNSLGDIASALFKFDLSFLPRETTITKADLVLRVGVRQGNGILHTALYPLLRPWQIDVVHWINATLNEKWEHPGADGPADRAMTPVSAVDIDHPIDWYRWNVQPLAQQWVQNPDANYGFILRAARGAPITYKVVSSEFTDDSSKRPRLEVQYELYPVPTPTATATPTMTPTPYGTPTVTPTPTNTPTATPTWTPTATPLPPTLTWEGTAVADAYISGWAPNDHPTGTFLAVKHGALRTLLRFDLSAIPAGATVKDATITLRVAAAPSNPEATLTGYVLRQGWSETEVTWNSPHTGSTWQVPGADGDHDRAPNIAVHGQVTCRYCTISLDATDAAAAWLASPSANYGLQLRSSSYDEYRFADRTESHPAYRPHLVLHYYPPQPTPTATATPTITPTPTMTPTSYGTPTVTPTPTNTPTATPTWTPTATPLPPTLTWEGTAVADAYISGWAPNDHPTGTFLAVKHGALRTLLRFDLSAIPAGATVKDATITLRVAAAPSNPEATLTGYVLRQGWSETEVTWNSPHTGSTWQVPGADGDHDRAPNIAVHGQVTCRYCTISLDATDAAAAWLASPSANYGLQLRSSSYDEYRFADRTESHPAYRPHLVLHYYPPQPTPTATATPTVTATAEPTGTPTYTPSPTWTATPTSTPVVASYWLPLITAP